MLDPRPTSSVRISSYHDDQEVPEVREVTLETRGCRRNLKLELEMENSAGPVHGFSRRSNDTTCRNLHEVHVKKHQKLATGGSMGKTSTCKSQVKGSNGGTCDHELELEDPHTCILSYEGLHIIFSHKQLEPILLENHWIPVTLCRFAGWREYHFYKPKFSPILEDVLLRKVRLPEPIQDARKQDILKLVRRVNEMANKNILCAWVHKGPKIAPSFRNTHKIAPSFRNTHKALWSLTATAPTSVR